MLAPRLTAVVVLPTPPFWFATARTVPIGVESTVWIGRKVVRGRTGGSFLATHAQASCLGVRRGTQSRTLVGRLGERALSGHPRAARELGRRGRDLAEHVQVAVLGSGVGLHGQDLARLQAHL